MTDTSRRKLLQAAAAGLALGAMSRVMATPAPASGPATPEVPARLSDIDHIMILMKENRSFDHYFGSLSGVRGFDDRNAQMLSSGRSVFYQPDSVNPDGYLLPFRLDTRRTQAQRLHVLDHSWAGLHSAWNGGAMDNWVASRRRLNGAYGPLTMGYHTREDIPFYYALADAFTLCDGYFASMLGPTHPNRSFLWSGGIDVQGHGGGPAIDNKGVGYTWETYPERLERAGITWRIYHEADDYGCNQCKYFARFHDAASTSELYENAMRNRPVETLLDDLRRGNMPQVTWIIAPSTASEHPDYMPAAGEDYTHRILRALWSNQALWAKTVFILNYDENDGQFDHVAPPVPEPGTPGEYVNGMPVGLGFRVPCTVISPFSRGGLVCGDTFDHTSTLRLIEKRFGVEVPNLSAWRRNTAGDLTSALALGDAPDLSLPIFPDTSARLAVIDNELPSLPAPAAPLAQAPPKQESGTRLRRQRNAA